MNVLVSMTGGNLFVCCLDIFCVGEIVMQHSIGDGTLIRATQRDLR